MKIRWRQIGTGNFSSAFLYVSSFTIAFIGPQSYLISLLTFSLHQHGKSELVKEKITFRNCLFWLMHHYACYAGQYLQFFGQDVFCQNATLKRMHFSANSTTNKSVWNVLTFRTCQYYRFLAKWRQADNNKKATLYLAVDVNVNLWLLRWQYRVVVEQQVDPAKVLGLLGRVLEVHTGVVLHTQWVLVVHLE